MSSDQQQQQQQASASSSSSVPQQAKNYTIPLPMQSQYDKWYLDSTTADVHFTFDSNALDSGTRIPAHKILLATESDVFKRMFYGELKECDDIRISDVPATAFEAFLQFCYRNQVALSIESISDVLYLGHKYMVTNCVDVCIKFLNDLCNSTDNILLVLSIAMLHGHSELVKRCEQLIVLNTDTLLKSSDFLECDRLVLAHICNGNLLICSEVELFEACMAWVKAKSRHNILSKQIVDEHLGELFYDIRFGQMTIEEFCQLTHEYDAVFSTDFSTITKMIGIPDFQPDKFNTQRRQIKWSDGDGKIFKCDREISDKEYIVTADGCKEVVNFTTDKPLLLTKFTLSKLAGGSYSDLSIQVEITESKQQYEPHKVLLKMNANLTREKCTNVILPRPILIKAKLFYEISIKSSCRYEYLSKEVSSLETFVEFIDCRTELLSDDDDDDDDDDHSVQSGTEIYVGIISAMEFQKI